LPEKKQPEPGKALLSRLDGKLSLVEVKPHL
jgi:hypothetical protein